MTRCGACRGRKLMDVGDRGSDTANREKEVAAETIASPPRDRGREPTWKAWKQSWCG